MSLFKGVKVLIGTSSFGSKDQKSLNKLKEVGMEIIENPYKRKLVKEELMKLLEDDVEGIIAGLETIDREVMEKTNLKVISRCGSGMSNVDTEAAKDLGIEVRSTPDGPTLAVAELTIGAMLSLLRMIPQLNNDLHSGKWNKQIGRQLSRMTIAIVGFGRIGQRVATLLKPFHVKIFMVDPLVTSDLGSNVSLDRALAEADIVTLHCSGEEVVLGKSEFAKMRDGVFVLNAARGANVDEDALIEALDSGKVAGAWLDAFREEPYNGCLKDYPQVILTPHVGSYTLEGRKTMELETANNLIEAFEKIYHGQK